MSFFRYPGGKKKLLNQIHAQIPNLAGSEFRDVFFGGGSVGLSILESNNLPRQIWINDKDIGLSCLWSAVINYTGELKEKIKLFKPNTQSFYEFKKELLEISDVPDDERGIISVAFKKLAIHQISYSGLGVKSGGPLGGIKQESKYKIDCRWSPEYLCKKIDKIKKLFGKIKVRGEKCSSLDFESIILNSDCKSFLYLDPPYYVKGNELYQHGFSAAEHERLMDCLKNTKHDWLLSYDECPEIRELYSWAKIEECSVLYSINGSHQKKELLIRGG